MDRLGFWGSIASIVGLIGIPLAIVLYFATPSAGGGDSFTVSSSRQSGGITAGQVNVSQNPSAVTTGDQSPAIGSNNGNVYNNYYNGGNTRIKGDGYVLKRSTPLVDSPDLTNLLGRDAAKHVVCSAPAGTRVQPTVGQGNTGNVGRLWEVTILEGDCTGKVGWVSFESLSR